jgi:GNAT superfamily N-acetyltransferase
MSPSLFAQYIYERQNKSIVEDENGFASYYFIGETCYIEDIYVIRGMRNKGIAAKMADKIAADAKAKNAKLLMGSVNINTNNPTDSIKALLAYGFELQSANQNMIFLVKKLGDT